MSVDKKINYEIQGGVKNYRPSKMVTVPKIAKSSPDTPTAKLAYITPEEEKILIDLNLYGSLKGKPNRGPGGIPSLEGDFGGPGGFGGFQGSSVIQLDLRNYPSDTAISSSLGPFTITSSTTKVDTRARARSIALTISNTAIDTSWKLGTFRLDIHAGGRR